MPYEVLNNILCFAAENKKPVDFQKVATLLDLNPEITELVFFDCNFDDYFNLVNVLINRKIIVLDIKRCKSTKKNLEESLPALAKIESLERLSIYGVKINLEKILRALCERKIPLRRLSLRNCNIEEQDLTFIHQRDFPMISTLECLDLRENDLHLYILEKLSHLVSGVQGDDNLPSRGFRIREETTLKISHYLQKPPLEDKAITSPIKSIVFFTHVLDDGFGDLVHAVLTAKLFHQVHPTHKINLLIFINEERKCNASLIVKNILEKHGISFYLLDDKKFNKRLHEEIPEDILGQALLTHIDLLREAETYIEVSVRIYNLSKALAKLGLADKYHAFWSEVSCHIDELFDKSANNINARRLRLGLEMGIRFDEVLEKMHEQVRDKSHEETLSLLEDKSLADWLSKIKFNNQIYKPFLYYAYFRVEQNLVFFCELLRHLHQENDVINVRVKKLPAQDLSKLGYYVLTYPERKDISETDIPSNKPIIRFFANSLSYHDSNLIAAKSPLIGAGGDNSYFQGLSIPQLIFPERMEHDNSFYRYLIFLARHYKPDGILADYLENIYYLTSIGFGRKSYLASYSFFLNAILAQLQNHRAELELEYRQFIHYLKRYHNQKNILTHFFSWQHRKIWHEAILPRKANYKGLFTKEYNNQLKGTQLPEDIIQLIREYAGIGESKEIVDQDHLKLRKFSS